jgi:hypothetical protein
MAHAQNMTSIGDGRIKLYQRDDVKNAVWQCRIKMKGYRVPIRRARENETGNVYIIEIAGKF